MAAVQFPDDFDDGDRAYADSLVPDGVLVTAMFTVVAWMDADGDYSWRCYNASAEGARVAEMLGLLELGKLHLVASADTGLPIAYDGDEG